MGVGEMGLTPNQFWSLTLREFHIKHAAFARAEDRQRALVHEVVALVGLLDKKNKEIELRNANALRRYPIKPWL